MIAALITRNTDGSLQNSPPKPEHVVTLKWWNLANTNSANVFMSIISISLLIRFSLFKCWGYFTQRWKRKYAIYIWEKEWKSCSCPLMYQMNWKVKQIAVIVVKKMEIVSVQSVIFSFSQFVISIRKCLLSLLNLPSSSLLYISC